MDDRTAKEKIGELTVDERIDLSLAAKRFVSAIDRYDAALKDRQEAGRRLQHIFDAAGLDYGDSFAVTLDSGEVAVIYLVDETLTMERIPTA